MKPINLISGPRNLSTAIMYSFAQRNDTTVVDEPFYAAYLLKFKVIHPGREEILATMEGDPDKVIGHLEEIASEKERPICFIKNMAHHLVDMPVEFLKCWKNIFLIRDPLQILLSYSKVIEQPTMQDIGLARQYELWSWLKKKGNYPLVLDSGELLKDPEKVLTKLCHQLKISFNPSMLSWPAGGRQEDGIWAKYWYQNVHKSTGFQKPKNPDKTLPDYLKPLYLQAKNYYEYLRPYSIKA
jgi:hypothetical protein